MARYAKQIEATKAAHMASRALADAALVNLDRKWEEFSSGKIDIDAYAKEARDIVKFSYREAAVVAKALTVQQSEMEGWEPMGSVKDSAYLKSLLADVDRNIAEFKASDQDEKSARRLKLRIGLSATTAAERGFTDAQLEHYGELQSLGYEVKKLWQANFVNNEPCVDCVRLSGSVVPFNEEFPIPTLMKTAIYRDLQGPPLHVRCRCVMVVLITRADNLFDKVPTSSVTIPTTMSTDTVKSLPKIIFDGIIKLLRSIAGRIMR